MRELTRAERLRARAMIDQDWSEAETWYRNASPEEFNRMADKALSVLPLTTCRQLSEAEARIVLMAFRLVIKEVALRVEDADAETG